MFGTKSVAFAAMNFLSHYYFERFSHDAERVAGSILPDLLKNADKTLNAHPYKYEDRFAGNPKLEQLLAGWKRHLETDKLFHNSDYFYEHTHGLKLLIGPIVTGTAIRPSFLSHVALELLLDHLLLTLNFLHEDHFYQYLQRADTDAIRLFLQRCDITDTATFFTYFRHFIESAYTTQYRHTGQLSKALTNICYRLWPDRLNTHQQQQLTVALEAYKTVMADGFIDIFNEIESRLL